MYKCSDVYSYYKLILWVNTLVNLKETRFGCEQGQDLFEDLYRCRQTVVVVPKLLRFSAIHSQESDNWGWCTSVTYHK